MVLEFNIQKNKKGRNRMTRCVIIVTYEPELQHLRRLTESVEEALFIPIIVDNSEKNQVRIEMVSEHSKVISLGYNQGIAAAQNRGIEYALSIGAEIIGFFDQDSNADARLIQKLSAYIEKNEKCVVAPLALEKDTLKEYPAQNLNKIGYPQDVFVKGMKTPKKVDIVISSGMMTTATVLCKVGNYDEDYFIDFVDIEWCLRCKKANIPIYVLPDAVLLHKIGNENVSIEGMEITLHSPLRTYYKVRNSFLLMHKKNGFVFSARQIFPAIIHNFLLICRVNNKKSYLKYYFTGLIHGICGVRGKYREGKKNA